jgi:cysteine desulfurase/selenocysteine lyase
MDAEKLRGDFPLLAEREGVRPPVYFDSACQTLRPKSVLEAMAEYYETFPACAGRSAHRLATEVSVRCDDVRARAADFFGAGEPSEIAFLKNATEGLNTVIFGSGLDRGDEVITTDYEHNSVHVPLLRLAEERGVGRRIAPSLPDGTFDLEAFEEMMSSKVKLVAMCLTSNVTGYTLPTREVVDIAHANGAKVLFDAAQTAPSKRLQFEDLGVDYAVMSAHKMLGPSGVGIMFASSGSASDLRPLCYGGHGVTGTTLDSYELLPPPERFEAGLQNYSGIIGVGAALEYLGRVGLDDIREHEITLNKRMTRRLMDLPRVEILEPLDPNLRGGILAFNVGDISHHDVAIILDHSRDIMLRSGMLCCHSLFQSRHMDGCVRASVYLYNSVAEADAFSQAVEDIATKL